MTAPRPERILALAWICLALATGACAHEDWAAPVAEDQFPDPTDPAYPAEMLKARAERIRAVERWQNSLDALDRLIEFRRSAGTTRDASGNVVGTSGDSDLRSWRLDMQTELLRAKGALRRLERQVKADFQGEFPPWWPPDDD